MSPVHEFFFMKGNYNRKRLAMNTRAKCFTAVKLAVTRATSAKTSAYNRLLYFSNPQLSILKLRQPLKHQAVYAAYLIIFVHPRLTVFKLYQTYDAEFLRLIPVKL